MGYSAIHNIILYIIIHIIHDINNDSIERSISLEQAYQIQSIN